MNYDLFTLASDEKFLAQAYADYFAKRTDYYTKFMAMVTEATADTTLEDSESLLAAVDQDRQALIELVKSKASSLGVELDDMAGTSTEYIQAVNTIAQDADVVSYINQHYSSPDLILANLNAYLNRDYTPVVNDSDADRAKFLSFANTPDLDCYNKRLSTSVDDRITSICATYGINKDGFISLQAGYTTVKSVLSAIIEDGINVRNDTALKISFKDIEESNITTIFNRAYTVESLFEEIKDTIASGVSTAAAFSCLQLDSVSDRVQQFASIVGTKITDAAASSSAYIATLKAKVSDARTKVSNFVGYFMEMSGLARILDHESTTDPGYVTAEAAFSQITGANPMPLVDFSDITKVIGNGIKFCCVSIAKLFKAGWDALSHSIRKTQAKLTQTFADPYDIGETESKEYSHLISQFCIRKTGSQSLSFNTTDTAGERFKQVMQSHDGNWLKYSSIFGELLLQFKITSLSSSSIDVDYDFRFKPRPINPDAFYSIVKSPNFLTAYCAEYSGHTVYGSGGCYKVSDTATVALTAKSDFVMVDDTGVFDNRLSFMKHLITALRERENLYADCSSSESALYRAFYLGYQLAGELICCGTYEMLSSDNGSLIPTLIKIVWGLSAITDSNSMTEGCIQDVVTNLQFLQMAIGSVDASTAPGWPTVTTYTHPASSHTSATITRDEVYLNHVAIYMLTVFATHFADEASNPLSFEFMPYTNDTTDFTEPQFYIKTDAENQEVATAFMTGIAAIIVVAVITIAIGLTVKAIKLRRAAKLTAWIGQKDAAAWDGKTMSVFDMWKYNRKSRKLAKLQVAGSGIVGAASQSGLGSLATDPFYQRLLVSTVGGDAAIQKYLPSNDTNADSVLDSLGNASDSILTQTGLIKQKSDNIQSSVDSGQLEDRSAQDAIYYQLTKGHLSNA